MSRKQLWIAALAVVVLVSSPATAQDENNQLAGILGRTFISNEGIKGAMFSNPFVCFGNSRINIRGDVRDFRPGEPEFPLAPTGKTRQPNFSSGGAEPSGTSSVKFLGIRRS